MKKYRYGEFKPKDHLPTFIKVIGFLAFTLIGAILDLPLWLVSVPLVYAIIDLLAVYLPFREQFIINETCIDVYKGKKKDTIPIPNELTLIISPFDVCPLLATRTAIQKQTYVLKDRCSVSILTGVHLDETLRLLHCNHIKQYTSSNIKAIFNDWRYIYNFVLDSSDMLKKIITDRKCTLIIPKSMLNKIRVDDYSIDVYVDDEC